MEHRNYYIDIESFLADPSFQLWVRAQNDEQCWEEWTLENPKRAKLVEEARLWILAMKVSEESMNQETIESALESTWEKIEVKNKSIHKPIIKLWNTNWFKGVAAILIFGLLSGLMYQKYFESDAYVLGYQDLIEENAGNLVEQTNNSNKPQIITLSDGSSILLQPNSKLSYPKTFAENERKVYLSGEGFFEISKNPKRPFYVYANEIVTKVVGTSFRIKAFSNEPNIEVLVRTGKVEVQSNSFAKNSKNQEVALLPNQAIRFTRKDLTFTKITDITQDKILSEDMKGTIEQLSFEFTDIPVYQIFKTIEQGYLVEIDFPEDKLKECYLTTSLSDQPLPEKLKIICVSIGNGTEYSMIGNHIIIKSNGCN
jgi:transmembrane sensor